MHESRSSQDLAALARSWRIFVPFLVVTPLVVLALTSSKPATYESSAEVLLSRASFVMAGLQEFSYFSTTRMIKTQAEIARLPDVAARVVEAADLQDRGRSGFLGQSSVYAEGSTNLMSFIVRDGDPEEAARLATIYAEQYIVHRTALDTRSLRSAIGVVERQLARARTQGADPLVYADLVRRQQQLHTALASLEDNVILVRRAEGARKIAPEPQRAALLALALGLVVGLGLAAVGRLLDPRARTADEVSEQLGLPLLGRLPFEGRAKGGSRVPAMLRPDESPQSEAIRALRTSVEFDERGRQPGILMVTSAVAGEGKSTTAANLAIALGRAGRHVVLVDLDLKRPAIARLFDLPRSPGISDLVRGRARLADVKHAVELGRLRAGGSPPTTIASAPEGTLHVVTAGTPVPADTAEIVAGRDLPGTLEALREHADVVLVDSPPLVESGDALALSAHVDGLLLVANLQRYRRRHARQLRQLLALSPAVPLGLVAVGEPSELEYVRDYGGKRDPDRDVHALGQA